MSLKDHRCSDNCCSDGGRLFQLAGAGAASWKARWPSKDAQ